MDDKIIIDNIKVRSLAETHAELMADTLGGKDDAWRARFAAYVREWLEKAAPAPRPKAPPPEPMTDGEARAFGRQPVPYGEFRGEPADAVPLDRLQWYADQQHANQRWTDDLPRYLRSRRVRVEEIGDGGWDEP